MPGVHPRARLVWMSLPEHFVPWRVVKAQWLDGEHVLREEEIKVGPVGWTGYEAGIEFE